MAAKYAAVSIQAGSACCAAVREVSGSVFLIGEVPRLPLNDCGAPDLCRCRYGKHNDRRNNDDDRRHFETAQRSLMYGGPEKRQKRRGRRDGD